MRKPGWDTATLGRVVEILDNRRVPVNAKERATRPGRVPYFGATGQAGWIDRAIFDEELVLLGEDGAPFFQPDRGVAYLIRGPSWVNNHAHVLRAGPRLTNRFLLHQLNQVDYRGFVSGTTRAKLPQGPMREIQLVLPPLPEQELIVSALEAHFSRLDAAVASLTRAKANVANARASVLKAAVEGKLGRVGATATRDDAWPTATVNELAQDLCDGPFGSNLKTEHYTEDGPRVVRLQNIGNGAFRDERAHIAPSHFERLRKHEVQAGDVIVASLGEVLPRACIAPAWLGPAIVKADCIRMRVNPTVLPGWLNIALNSPPVRRATTKRIHGVGRPRLGLSGIREISVPLPSLAEQRALVSEVERRLSVLEATEPGFPTRV